jgi:hypothetical protein
VALLAPTQHVEAKVSMLKWKLMITTLPVPVAAIIVRLVLEHFFKNYMNNYSGVMDFSALAPVLTGGVFLIGLMLSGTLQDYKESEKIPAELATCLETIEETVSWVSANRPAVSDRAMKEVVAEVTDEMVGWLLRKRTPEQGFAAIEKLNSLVKDFDKLNAGLPAVRMMTEIHNLRRTMTRIGVISRTGFLASGYALLDLLVVSVLTLLVIASYKAEFGLLGKYIIIGFVSLIYSYLWRLVRDVDDPFEYGPTGERTGAAEVELFPLLEYQARARERLAGKTIEERIAAGAAKAEPDAGGPSIALLAGVGVGCLCAGALVVYLLSRTLEKPTAPPPVTAAPNVAAPAAAKDGAGPAVDEAQKAAAKPAAGEAPKASATVEDSGKAEAAEKSGPAEAAAEEESGKKSKRRHHRRKKE